MKHEWEPHPESYSFKRPFEKWRRCKNCGAEQKRELTGYDRLDGSRYGWGPKVGRCRDPEPEKLTKPTADPVEIRHNRWRNKAKGYEVKVVSTRTFHGKHGFYSTVTVVEKGTKAEVRWPALAFVQAFEPLGRPRSIKSVWQRL